MERQFQETRENQKASWNKFSPGWKKWNAQLQNHMKPASDAIISLLEPEGSQLILDIASGTGEPGLTIATMLTTGKVIVTDLSDGMLNVAREIASDKGVNNVEFLACDVCELPFADNSFDSVSCRMGFMFFPDMLLAAKEIRRVLKPGGRLATAVWGPAEKNFWVTIIGEIINRNLQLPLPPRDAPAILRCSKSGFMTGILGEAGFKNMNETEVTCNLECVTAENFWQMMNEIAAPVVGVLSKASEAMKDTIKKEVCQSINEKYPGDNIVLDGCALLIYGEK